MPLGYGKGMKNYFQVIGAKLSIMIFMGVISSASEYD